MTTLAQEIESKYEVLQKMGEGGMGAVYKVRHRFLDDIQVIKLMQAKFQENAELKTRFLREAKTAKLLRHPNIAEVVDFNLTADGTAYIVMEFIEGVNLSEILARTGGPLDHRLVVSVARQALTALAFLHRKKFVHRDISPDNLMLTRDSEGMPLVKLIDLGITKSVEETHSLTMAGKFIGKVHYASPEQFGGEVDGRSDLYSFGVVLYELLTGTKPISGSDYFNIITGHMTRPPKPFEDTDPGGRVPILLRRAVLKALSKDPVDRFQSADEFADALKDLQLGTFDATVEVLLPVSHDTHPGEGGDAMERADWDAALATNTIKAWESYLDRHATSSRADRARKRLEELESAEEVDWNRAARSESSDAWRRYLDRHTDSPRASMARRRLEKMHATEMEERAWAEAVTSNSVAGWDLFIAAHTGSPRIEEARSLQARARQRAEEDHAWRTAAESDSPASWRLYLASHPATPRAAEARARLLSAEDRERENDAWDEAVSSDHSDGWRRFMDAYPESSRVKNAKTKLVRAADREAAARREAEARQNLEVENRGWDEAVRWNSADGWESFIRAHPDSDRLSDAMGRLATLRENDRKEVERAQREQQNAIEDAAWQSARSAHTTAAVRAFLEAHPASQYLTEGRELLQQIQQEKRLEAEREEARQAEEKRQAEERRLEEQRAEEKRGEEKRAAEERRAAARRAEEEEERRAAQKRAEEKRAQEETRAASAREQRRAEEERLAEQRAAFQRAERQQHEEKQHRESQRELNAVPLTGVPVPRAAFPETVDDSVQPATAKRSLGKPLLLGGLVLATILAGVVVVMSRSKRSAAAPVSEQAVASAASPTPAAAAPGQLLIHVTPWGEVRSVKNAAGEEQLASAPLYTPVTLTLPAGEYQVELANPNSRRTATVPVTLAAGTTARAEAELDRIDADDYLRKVLAPR